MPAMKGFRRLVVSAAAAFMLATNAVPASATEVSPMAASDCATGYFCIWRDTSYKTDGKGSAFVRAYRYIPNYALWNYSGTSFNANDSATSFRNASGTSQIVYVYQGANATGARWAVNAGVKHANLVLSLSPSGWNDKISSAYYQYYDPNV